MGFWGTTTDPPSVPSSCRSHRDCGERLGSLAGLQAEDGAGGYPGADLGDADRLPAGGGLRGLGHRSRPHPEGAAQPFRGEHQEQGSSGLDGHQVRASDSPGGEEKSSPHFSYHCYCHVYSYHTFFILHSRRPTEKNTKPIKCKRQKTYTNFRSKMIHNPKSFKTQFLQIFVVCWRELLARLCVLGDTCSETLENFHVFFLKKEITN